MKKTILRISGIFLLGVVAILGIVIGVQQVHSGTNLGDFENNDSVIFDNLQENGIRLRQNKITQNGSGVTITAEIYPASAIKPQLEWEFSTASGKKWKTEEDDLIPGMDSYPTISDDTLTIEFWMYGYWTETIVLNCWVKDNPEISASINLECVGREVTSKTLDTVIVPNTYSLETMTMAELLNLCPTAWYNEKSTGGTLQGDAKISELPEYIEFAAYDWTEGSSGEEEVHIYSGKQLSWENVKDLTVKQFITENILKDDPVMTTFEEALQFFLGEKIEGIDTIGWVGFVYSAWVEYEGKIYVDDFYANPYAGFSPKFDMSNILDIQSINLGSSTIIF